jgi:MoaA/NifB/PqqE/SkfB family radical SAM enzyme
VPSAIESSRRFLALARAVWRSRSEAFDPFKLTWILTEQCSLRCRSCHLWVKPDLGPSLDVIRRVLRANRHLTWLNLSGGDLVEREDAPPILEAAARECPDLALLDFPTAGQDRRRTLAALEPALDSDIPRIYVTVSIDGPDEVHDRVRGLRGAAARARETYRALRAIRRPGFRVVAGMTLSRHNLPAEPPGRLDELLPRDIPIDDLHLNLAHQSDHYYRNTADVTPPTATALALIDELDRRRSRRFSPLSLMERRYWRSARRYLVDGRLDRDCGALRASVYVAADLTVQPCTIFDHPLGNLADIGYALRRLPELPAATQALGLVDARACPGCWSPCEAFPSLLAGLGTSSAG